MKYDVAFTPGSTYDRMLRMLTHHASPGLVVDLGCGAGAIGAPLVDAGFTYLGVDADLASVEHVRALGHESMQLDLAQLDRHLDQVVEAIGGRPVSAILALDVIEHLPDPHRSFSAVRSLADACGCPLVGLSIPNVSHVDLATKLLVGRWEVTDMGLLDHTHVRFFTEAALIEHLDRIGVAEIERDDVVGQSDQYFPVGLPAISGATPLGHLLRQVRSLSDANDRTIQFVRLFRLEVAVDHDDEPRPVAEPFLTVLRRGDLPTDARSARGSWVVVLGPDDRLVVEADEVLRTVPAEMAGRAVRWGVRRGDREAPRPGDVIDEIAGPHTDLAALAIPGEAWRSGLLPLTAGDHELVVRVVELLGVVDVDTVVVEGPPRPQDGSLPEALDGRALVLPPGMASRLADLARRAAAEPEPRARRRFGRR